MGSLLSNFSEVTFMPAVVPRFLLGSCCPCSAAFLSWFSPFFTSFILAELFPRRGWAAGSDRPMAVWMLVRAYFFLHLGGVLFLVSVCLISAFRSSLWEERRFRVLGGVAGLLRFTTSVVLPLAINTASASTPESTEKKKKLAWNTFFTGTLLLGLLLKACSTLGNCFTGGKLPQPKWLREETKAYLIK